ncbi:hypothetical protein DB30_02039 [Enhygromyxa salina]|uniref:Uncharacterized protein n=1 Tax=Enhygromyxa salina TaxID=215803 RepID=A0A0C1Z3B3_9BACT|nr:hypothetical protein DB30_02039 [Enhygromyxa salina]
MRRRAISAKLIKLSLTLPLVLGLGDSVLLRPRLLGGEDFSVCVHAG